MNSKFIFLLLLLVSLLACSSNHRHELVLFNGITFQLHKGERLVELSSSIKDNYFQFGTEVPLYRCVDGQNYIIYLGIPIAKNNSIEYNQCKDDKVYKVEYTAHFDKSSVYILATSNSQSIVDSLFTLDSLATRFTSARTKQ